MSGHGHALPRIKARRRKPRGPEWRKAFASLSLDLAGLALFLLWPLWIAAGGMVLAVALDWRLLWTWPADPEAPKPTEADLWVNLAMSTGVVVLLVVQWVVCLVSGL